MPTGLDTARGRRGVPTGIPGIGPIAPIPDGLIDTRDRTQMTNVYYVSGTLEDYILQHSPAVILASFILDGLPTYYEDSTAIFTRLASGGDWPMFTASMPDGNGVPNNCACTYDTTGYKDGRLMRGPVIYHFGTQLRIRCTAYNDAYVKMQTILAAICRVKPVNYTMDDITYRLRNISPTTPVVALGEEPEAKGRYNFTVNFLMTLNRVA